MQIRLHSNDLDKKILLKDNFFGLLAPLFTFFSVSLVYAVVYTVVEVAEAARWHLPRNKLLQ